MAISTGNVIPLSQARANLPEMADQVKAGAGKNHYQLERERIHLLQIDDTSEGLADIAAGKVKDARNTLNALKRRRAAKAT